MEEIRVHIKVSGKVQGVWFRDNVKKEARELKLKGWVKNLPTGEVEAVFEGPENRIKEILLYCRHGPKLAKVNNIEVKYEKPLGEKTFRIT